LATPRLLCEEEDDGEDVDGENEDDSDEDDEEEDDDEEDDAEMDVDTAEPTANEERVAPLSVSEPDAVETSQQMEEDSDEDEEDVLENGKGKPSRKQQKKKRQSSERAAERRIETKEEALLGQGKVESVQEFERLVVASPNSSYIWIKYIAYFVAQAEIGKAREISERALKAISFREEKEKMNIWTARLNLENMYGTDESLERVLKEAVQYCDPLQIHSRLADIYSDTNKVDKAESQHRFICKKFRERPHVWVEFGKWLFSQERGAETSEVMDKALKAVHRTEHVQLICKFAQLEFKHASPERGRTLFDSILSNYPKRVDVWSIYIDTEKAYGDVKAVRRVMERATSLNLSTKKMKFLFTKYLDFEKEHGTEESANSVKEKAREYIRKKASGTSA